jgi:hypothetical protein
MIKAADYIANPRPGVRRARLGRGQTQAGGGRLLQGRKRGIITELAAGFAGSSMTNGPSLHPQDVTDPV